MLKRLFRVAAYAVLLSASLCAAEQHGGAHYVGAETCAICHKAIAATQERTAMANTWQGRFASWLPPSFAASVTDDGLLYRVTGAGQALTYTAPLPDGKQLTLPVEPAMGGKRHGLGFLVRTEQIDGLAIARPVLVQARYAWSSDTQKLLLAPGCVPGKPKDVESSLGLVLSPSFEARCLACHGQPNSEGSGAHGGVHCESCHGPGSEHLRQVGKPATSAGILNPARLSAEGSMAVCARCHVGLARFADPSPDDLLIANQVRAIRSSECSIQSAGALSCTTCHDPHNDSVGAGERTVKACLGCHSGTASHHASTCPVNAKGNCVSCHMPSVNKGPLHLVDHYIRVHPEQISASGHRGDQVRTNVIPTSEYLRIIAASTAEAASAALDRLKRGDSFYVVARELSIDKTAAVGGYLGQVTIADLGTDLARNAGQLNYGETTPVLSSGSRWIILQRLPRDFRWDAEQLQLQAEGLASQGDSAGAIAKAQSALKIYPHFLRALDFIAAIYANSGNVRKAEQVLRVAASIYPNDARTQFALGSALASLGQQDAADAIYRKVIALDVDFLPAYVNLGISAYKSANWPGAIQTFREGLGIDPLCAELNYDLGLALKAQGDLDAAKRAIALAGKLDPRFASDLPDSAVQPHRSGSF